MKNKKQILVGILAMQASFFATGTLAGEGDLRNIILCIADGMGYEHIKAGGCYLGTNLVFETFPYQSSMTTYSANSAATDSAASATAMATGVKVYNYVVSLAHPGDGGPLETVLEYYQARGKSTGLVTTENITDATPAAFAAHTGHRGSVNHIIENYLNFVRPNLLFGGANGLTAADAIDAGFTVVTNRAGLNALNTATETYVSGQFGTQALPFHTEGLGDLPDLHEMVPVALDLLARDPDGFFLLVEEERTDSAAHINDITNCTMAVVEFSKSVEQILEWMQGRDDTLLIVTADHETGGLTVTDEGIGRIPSATWTTLSHTSNEVPVYAFGKNAHLVTNVFDNTDINTLARSPATVPQTATAYSMGEAGFELEWTSTSGAVYRLERAISLSSNQWIAVETRTATSYRVTFNPPHSGTNTFFRLISE